MFLCLLLWFCCVVLFVCFKQKTAYELRIVDWSSDVCSSELGPRRDRPNPPGLPLHGGAAHDGRGAGVAIHDPRPLRGSHARVHGLGSAAAAHHGERKSAVSGKSVSVRVALGGRRIIKKKKTSQYTRMKVNR